MQTPTDSAVAIAASYAAKAFGIRTGTLVKDARRLCPAVVPVQARHRVYTEYHERILKAVDTCLPVDKVCSIDEVACRFMGTERQVEMVRDPVGGAQEAISKRLRRWAAARPSAPYRPAPLIWELEVPVLGPLELTSHPGAPR